MSTRTLLCWGLILLAAVLPGCTPQDIEKIKVQVGLAQEQVTKVDEAIALLRADQAKIEAEAASLPDGQRKTELLELAQEYGIWIAKSSQWREQLAVHLESLNASIQAAEDEIDLAEAVGQEVGKALPPPIGTWVALGTLLVVAVWRAVRNGRQAAAGTAAVRAIEAAKIAGDGKVDFTSAGVRQMLSATMGKGGEAFVDAVQGKK